MASQRILAGVAHDIAHFAVSSISCVNPHLSQACGITGRREVSIELLRDESYPPGLPQVQPLELALGALRVRFLEILQANGLTTSGVASASLTFRFPVVMRERPPVRSGAHPAKKAR